MSHSCTIVLVLTFALCNHAARILVVIPTPSLSHQVVFYPLTQELAKRSHEVVVITTDPAFAKGEAPPNLTEIDIHDITYEIFRKELSTLKMGSPDKIYDHINAVYEALSKTFANIVQTDEVQNLLRLDKDYFDLLMIETLVRPALIFSYFFKAPVISISSLGAQFATYVASGAPLHPLLYPLGNQDKIYNLSIWDQTLLLRKHIQHVALVTDYETINNDLLRKIVGPEIPTLKELMKNIDMIFLNVYPIWADNEPVPPNVIFLGGLHNTQEIPGITKNHKTQEDKELPQDLISYLNSSKHGVVYMSLGTNVQSSQLGLQTTAMFWEVFAELPYNFLVKWDMDNTTHPENVRLVTWVPQSNLLKHSKVKLFITQCGLQSTDEAIVAGVPVIGIPMFIDQFYNSEKYIKHKIGLKYEIKNLTPDILKNAIRTVIEDEIYYNNVIKLRSIMYDQPQTSLERAIWWTEHVLQHGGAKHLRAPAANTSLAECYELELVLICFVFLLSLFVVIFASIYCSYKFIFMKLKRKEV
ncbi:UDP-glucosyltransferase 2-like [Epargyreus clarus]|uniref:UDP-glucosyltransferase 2-like n=1 Tax=Epargyreus clarus TaxID=520877 RepID=UPI003C2D71F4